MENNLRLSDNMVLSLDFGGTKLAAAVVDLATEKIVSPVIRQLTLFANSPPYLRVQKVLCGQ